MCPLLLAWRAPAIQISSVFWTHLQQYTTVPQYRYESDQIQTPNSTSQKAKWNIANTRHPGGPRFVVLYFAVWISSLYLDHSKGINWRNVHVFRLSRQFSIKTMPQDRLRSLDSGYHTWCNTWDESKTPLNWYVLFFFRQKNVLHQSFMLIRSIMASSSNGIFSTLLVQWAEQHLKQLARLMPPPAWRGKGHLRDKAAAVPSPLTLPYTQTSYLAFVSDLFLQRNHPASQWIHAPWFYLFCLFRFLIATMED